MVKFCNKYFVNQIWWKVMYFYENMSEPILKQHLIYVCKNKILFSHVITVLILFKAGSQCVKKVPV